MTIILPSNASIFQFFVVSHFWTVLFLVIPNIDYTVSCHSEDRLAISSPAFGALDIFQHGSGSPLESSL